MKLDPFDVTNNDSSWSDLCTSVPFESSRHKMAYKNTHPVTKSESLLTGTMVCQVFTRNIDRHSSSTINDMFYFTAR